MVFICDVADLRMHMLAPRPHSIVVPDDDYLEKVQALCRKHNVLLICDEVQTVRVHSPFDCARVHSHR